MKKPELLSPGGSFEGIRAAVCAGADAVYAGGSLFGARAYADNPGTEQMIEAIDFCHLHGKKLYMTVNTLLREDELEGQLYDYLLPYYEHGLDAVLVQDLGVLSFIRKQFPDLPVHASTQLSISSADGAAMMKDLGVERIVPARELTLGEIRYIHDHVPIEIETFAHGALCFCYSGQCLMSSMIGGRSGNRGRCAQPCRRLYQFDGSIKGKGTPQYALSLKDINTLSILPKILEAGVDSLKLEGRMKRTEYGAGVTLIYRKYLDRAVRFIEESRSFEDWKVEEEDLQMLMDLYNRGGFSTGYYEVPKGRQMMCPGRPNHAGTQALAVTARDDKKVTFKALEDIFPGDVIEITDRGGASGDELTLSASLKKGDSTSLPVKGAMRKVRKGQILSRMRCQKLLDEIARETKTENIPVKIKGTFMFHKGIPVTLKVTGAGSMASAYGPAPEKAKNRPVLTEDLERQLRKTGGSGFVFEELEIDADEDAFLPMGEISSLRREALRSLEEKILETALRKRPERLQPSEKSEAYTHKEKVRFTAHVLTGEQLDAVLKDERVEVICLDAAASMPPAPALSGSGKKGTAKRSFREDAKRIHAAGKQCFLDLPNVWRENTIRDFFRVFDEETMRLADGLVLHNVQQLYTVNQEEYAYLKAKTLIAGQEIYSWNERSRSLIAAFGAGDTVSAELNSHQILKGEGAFVIYGRTLLMTTAQCLTLNHSGCECGGKGDGFSYLTDSTGACFPVRRCCGICSNQIYNSLPLDLTGQIDQIKEKGRYDLHLYFTDETAAQTAFMINKACAFADDPVSAANRLKDPAPSTRGHFKRGVE